MELSDRKWKPFYLSELFEITSTQSGIDKNKLNQKRGLIPYITRTDKNNGIERFIACQDIKYKIDNAKVITIGLDTQTVFYQPYHFYTGQNIQVLKNEYISKYVALFILPSLSLLLKKFSWGSTGATLGRLKNSRIFLPMNKKGNPDYEFMEAYMREKEEKFKKQYKEFIASRLDKSCKKPETPKQWKVFEIGKIFDVNKGSYLHSSKIKNGNNPYITAITGNNGINKFIGNNILFEKNHITIEKVNFSCYFQPISFYCSHDVSVLKNEYLNKTISLFICTLLNRYKDKYSYGRQAQMNVVKKEKILLPITSSGQPDYAYMDNYMKYLEQQKLKGYIKYIEKRSNL